jgi:hypothetical protein
MKKLLLSIAFLTLSTLSAFANGFGYDAQGRYYQWYNTPQGGFGYDTDSRYYQWYNTPSGGYSYDGNGGYHQWYIH